MRFIVLRRPNSIWAINLDHIEHIQVLLPEPADEDDGSPEQPLRVWYWSTSDSRLNEHGDLMEAPGKLAHDEAAQFLVQATAFGLDLIPQGVKDAAKPPVKEKGEVLHLYDCGCELLKRYDICPVHKQSYKGYASD